jgi:hypothetical protein
MDIRIPSKTITQYMPFNIIKALRSFLLTRLPFAFKAALDAFGFDWAQCRA